MKRAENESIKVFIADDDADLLELVTGDYVKPFARFELLGTAQSPEETIMRLKSKAPDILVLDVFFCNSTKTGFDLIAEARAIKPGIKILIITGLDPKDKMEVKSMRARANGFLRKSFSMEEFLEAMLTIFAGKLFYNMGALERLQETLQVSSEEALEYPAELTNDDWEYLKLKLQGIEDSEIAKRLNILDTTIDQKRYRIAQRLGLDTDIESYLLGKLIKLSNIKTS